MTVSELLAKTTSLELAEWMAYFIVQNEPKELTPEEETARIRQTLWGGKAEIK